MTSSIGQLLINTVCWQRASDPGHPGLIPPMTLWVSLIRPCWRVLEQDTKSPTAPQPKGPDLPERENKRKKFFIFKFIFRHLSRDYCAQKIKCTDTLGATHWFACTSNLSDSLFPWALCSRATLKVVLYFPCKVFPISLKDWNHQTFSVF